MFPGTLRLPDMSSSKPVFREDLLRGRTVLITGGGSGLGLSIAKGFHRLGAQVAIVGRSPDRLAAAATEIEADGDRISTHPADVRDFDAVERVVEEVEARFGAPQVLVNAAAGNFLAATEELTPNGFDAIVRTVLHGTFHATLAVGRRMIEARGGSILNIVTTYAWTGSAFVVPSASAKAGVLAMTRSLAVEWAGYGIRVNAIAPGPFPTPGAWQRLVATPEMERHARERVPVGRFGEHDELVNLAAFLASDAAPFLTGECVTIDGGEWIGSGGEFNFLTRMPREQLKAMFSHMRGR